MSKLDKELSIQRNKPYNNQDPANPHYYLTIANSKDIEAITKKWHFPELYLKFLKHYSPIQVTIKNINL